MNHSNVNIPAYFSHSYRPEDRSLNQNFWKLLFNNSFRFTVDPKSNTFSVSYLELMMQQSACFVAVVTERTDQLKYRCSPYILFEYGLSVQAKKPSLLFVENGVRASYFEHEEVCFFSRKEIENDNNEKFLEKINILREKSVGYRNLAIKGRGKVGFIFDQTSNYTSSYTSAIPKMKALLDSFGYDTEDVKIDFDYGLKFSLKLDRYDFVIISVDPTINPSWIYPFIHGRFIPSIRLMNRSASSLNNESLHPLLANSLLQEIGSFEDFIIFWQEENDLVDKLKIQLKKFDQPRIEFQTLEEGNKYFHSIGREPASVFISNANDSNIFSQSLSKALSIENISHFQYKYQNNIEIGKEWENDLLNEIRKSKVFVALITQSYFESIWCMKEYELAIQLWEKKQIEFIPYFLEDKINHFLPMQGASLSHESDDVKRKKIIKDIDKILININKKISEPTRAVIANRIDVAIITILPEEYKAVLDQLDKHYPAPNSTKHRDLHAWEIGEIQSPGYKTPYRVVVAMASNAGNISGYQVTKATLDRWNPRYILLVGIAGGRSVDSLKKGDVVISDRIWNYEYGKIEKEFVSRHKYSYLGDTSIVASAQSYAVTRPSWTDTLKAIAPDKTEPAVKVGLFASGDKVIDNLGDPFVKRILKAEPKLLAIEMEGAGAAAAVKAIGEEGKAVGFAMIRGISDLPKSTSNKSKDAKVESQSQTQERDTWKQFAAGAAACFATNLIKNRWIEPPVNN